MLLSTEITSMTSSSDISVTDIYLYNSISISFSKNSYPLQLYVPIEKDTLIIMSILDQLDINTLFLNRDRRIIQCKNSYERMLVYKFAKENMLNAKKIEMKDSYGNIQMCTKLRCKGDCKGYLSISTCGCGDEYCDTWIGRCSLCKYTYRESSPSRFKRFYAVKEPVYGICLSRKKVPRTIYAKRTLYDIDVVCIDQ